MTETTQINLDQPFRLGAWTIYPESGEMKLPTGKSVTLRRLEMDVLLYLSSRPGEVVSAKEVLEHVWSRISVNEESVYHYVSVLRRALGQDYTSDNYIQTIPKRGYRLVADVSPVKDGAVEQAPAAETGTTASSQMKSFAGLAGARPLRLLVAVMLVLAGALLLFVIGPQVNSPDAIRTSAKTAEVSIAVLPFVNLSSDPEQAYFADGVSEELLNRLARIPDLKVISRSSSFAYRGQNADTASVGAQLNVNHILEGSVRRSGSRVRITAQLIAVNTQAHIWSETYEREVTDIFTVQDQISNAIADALQISLGVEARGPSPIPGLRAYDLILKSRGLMARRNLRDIKQAAGLLEEAVLLAPEYAEAYAVLAMARLLESARTIGQSPEVMDLMIASKELSEKALSLDPKNVTALTVLGSYHMFKLNLEQSEAFYLRALEISPTSAEVNNWYGDLLSATMRVEEALVREKRAAQIEPLQPNNYWELGLAHALAGHGEEALAAYEKALEMDPGRPSLAREYKLMLVRFGKIERLEMVIASDLEKRPSSEEDIFYPVWVALARSDKETVSALLDGIGESARTGREKRFLLALRGLFGDYDRIADSLMPWSENWSFLPTNAHLFPSDPEILSANPKYAAMWQKSPLDRVLKARGHWVEPEVNSGD